MRKFALYKRGPNVETSLDKAKHATLANFKPIPMALPGLHGWFSFFSGLFPEGQVREHHFLG